MNCIYCHRDLGESTEYHCGECKKFCHRCGHYSAPWLDKCANCNCVLLFKPIVPTSKAILAQQLGATYHRVVTARVQPIQRQPLPTIPDRIGLRFSGSQVLMTTDGGEIIALLTSTEAQGLEEEI